MLKLCVHGKDYRKDHQRDYEMAFDYLLCTLDNALLDSENSDRVTPLDIIRNENLESIQAIIDAYSYSARIANELLTEEETKVSCKKRKRQKNKKNTPHV